MLYSFKTTDVAFSKRMATWRKQAAIRYFGALAVLFTTPILVGVVQQYVSPETVSSRFVTMTIGSWHVTYLAAILLMFLLVELLSALMVRLAKESKVRDARLGVLLKPLCHKAGLEGPVRILELRSGRKMNAAALRSFSFGRKVLLIGDMTKLERDELEAVLAHEVAHLAMRDVRSNHVLQALLLAARMLNIIIGVALLSSLVYKQFDLTWFLLVASLMTSAGVKVSKHLSLSYSRVCEYRADGLAVHWTSPHHRHYLISAIKKVREVGLSVLLEQHERQELDWNKTHPTLTNRARSLGIILKKVTGQIGLNRA